MSNNYRVVVGDQTQVLKIEVGTPTRNVLISNQVNLNDVIGITTSNIQEGDILIADSDGILRNSQSSVSKIDGKVSTVILHVVSYLFDVLRILVHR